LSSNLNVADVFGGVGTTALSGMASAAVTEVRSLEYSPFARFVGETKVSWPQLDPDQLRRQMKSALDYDHQREVSFPSLSTFGRPEVFTRPRLRALLAARDHLRELPGASSLEKRFFLLGLASVTEDLSGAMKDGRALRIKGDRSRRPSSLAGTDPGFQVDGPVKRALAGQWTAMVDDLEAVAGRRADAAATTVHHLQGDARQLQSVQLNDGRAAFLKEWADLSLFSPPYLNCIDYTELYKLELWLLEHILDEDSFKRTRLGTLRSHPSVRFPETSHLAGRNGTVIKLIEGISSWMTKESRRPATGVVVLQYFEDMFKVFEGQHRLLRPGAAAVCVVANSTFSRREKGPDGGWEEKWRLPVLTDVVLAHLALLAGFDSVEILDARELRPRNVKNGRARESLVVATKG